MTHEDVLKLHQSTITMIKNYKKSLSIKPLMVDEDTYAVQSQNSPEKAYLVSYDRDNGYWQCPCDGFNYRAICTHVLSTLETIGELETK